MAALLSAGKVITLLQKDRELNGYVLEGTPILSTPERPSIRCYPKKSIKDGMFTKGAVHIVWNSDEHTYEEVQEWFDEAFKKEFNS